MASKGKRLNQFQHALLRPDTYIGSIVPTLKNMYVVFHPSIEEIKEEFESGDDETETEDEVKKPFFEQKEILFNPGLFNIIREIGANAIDNKWVSLEKKIPMTHIDITASLETGEISFENDGYFISVNVEEFSYTDPITQKDSVDTMFPAQLYFGYMLAGTNFDDEAKRKNAGRNGMGSKATNVFSKKFRVDCFDPDQQKQLTLQYEDNLTKRHEPIVKNYKGKKGGTKVTFTPDYKRFGFEIKPGENVMPQDVYLVIEKFAYDTAMLTGLKVKFNSESIIIKDMTKYARLFYPDAKVNSLAHFKSETGEAVLLEVEEFRIPELDNVKHISFINGIATLRGGAHVDAWRDAIFPPLVKAFNALPGRGKGKDKIELKTTAKGLYPYFILFIREEADNPEFDTQTKDFLTTPQLKVPKLEAAEISKILKWNFIDILEEKLMAAEERKNIKKEKSVGSKINDEKYKKANEAGGKNSEKCTLFPSEGLSAKATVDGIISHIEDGHDWYGSYAIQGKFLNCRKASIKKIIENEEVKELQKILGLIPYTDYMIPENRKMLNYGAVNFFTDADDDGIHIRALLADFFYFRYPSLWKTGFFKFESESTPVVKIFPTKNSKTWSHLFYSNDEVKKFYQTTQLTGKEQIDYYKGLATIDDSEHEYLANNRKKISFITDGNEEKYLKLAFDPKEKDPRKKWMVDKMKSDRSNHSSWQYQGEMQLSSFINNQLVVFEIATLKRAIPSVYDGLKDGQRKILFTLLKKKIYDKIGVVNIQGKVLDEAKYHHGADSITGTIIGMAQKFVGKNNLPLIQGFGQFGTRDDGGKKTAGADRYIKACLEEITKIIFNPQDSELLTYIEDQGVVVEPKHYIPTVCMLAINGAEGMATGFSTNIPPHNPLDVVSYQEAWLDGTQSQHPKLIPYWRGFTGKVWMTSSPSTKNKDVVINRVHTQGTLQKAKDGWWDIKELPIGMWTNTMKAHITKMMSPQKDKKGKERPICIVDMKEYPTNNRVHLRIKPAKDFIPDIDTKQNFNNLTKTIALSNMRALNLEGFPVLYPTIEALIDDYCEMRLKYYEQRHLKIIKNIESAIPKIANKVKFIVAVINKKLKLYQDQDLLEKDMVELGLERIYSTKKKTESESETEGQVEGEDEGQVESETEGQAESETEGQAESEKGGFEYLLTMPIKSMTKKRVEDLKKEFAKLKESLEIIKSKTPKMLWKEDLAEFKKAYAKFDKEN